MGYRGGGGWRALSLEGKEGQGAPGGYGRGRGNVGAAKGAQENVGVA